MSFIVSDFSTYFNIEEGSVGSKEGQPQAVDSEKVRINIELSSCVDSIASAISANNELLGSEDDRDYFIEQIFSLLKDSKRFARLNNGASTYNNDQLAGVVDTQSFAQEKANSICQYENGHVRVNQLDNGESIYIGNETFVGRDGLEITLSGDMFKATYALLEVLVTASKYGKRINPNQIDQLIEQMKGETQGRIENYSSNGGHEE